MGKTYKDAGVDIEAGDRLVSKIKQKVISTYGPSVKSGVGGFASLYEFADHFLAAGTDGVGTKLKLAFELGRHESIGIDLVAMCVNDILCTGAKPLFFLDYIGTGRLKEDVIEKVIEGIVHGCKQAECALIGGETAEMPGMYSEGEYDLAGFCVGSVDKENILDGEKIKVGQSIIGLASSGFHSNGYSLIRSLVKNEEKELKEKLLEPTRIYWNSVKDLLKKDLLTGIAHITGGGIKNLARLSSQVNYELDFTEVSQNLPSHIIEIFNRSELSPYELYKTFNMGVGMMLITDKKEEVMECLEANLNYPFFNLGKVVEGSGSIFLVNESIEYKPTH